MQLAGTRAGDHRVGRADRPDSVEHRRQRSKRRMGQAIPAPAPGGDDACCRVGPGRGARLSTSPFPRTAPRTRRAGHPGTGLSTRPVGTVAMALGSAVPGLHCPVGTPVFTGDSCPADPPPPPRCAPSPCARLSRARTTTGTPPRPATNSGRRTCPPPEGGEGGHGSLPTFTTTRSTRSVSSYTPAASPGVRRSPSPWPPGRPLPTGCGVARRHRDGRALLTGPDPPGWSRHVAYGASTLVPRVHLLVLLAGPGPSGSTGPSRRCQGCSHPPVRLHSQAALSFTGLLRQASGGALPSPPGRGSASWRR